MGRSLALNMADHGYEVAAYNRSYALTQEMMEKYPHEHVHAYQDLKECIHSLMKPRKVMLMVKAGKPVDMVIEQLIPLLEEGDIIIDGGNSFFEDTIRREAYLKEKGCISLALVSLVEKMVHVLAQVSCLEEIRKHMKKYDIY